MVRRGASQHCHRDSQHDRQAPSFAWENSSLQVFQFTLIKRGPEVVYTAAVDEFVTLFLWEPGTQPRGHGTPRSDSQHEPHGR
ncbi:hypothetical protein V2G26_015766 [Clonostachys chloroleuca]